MLTTLWMERTESHPANMAAACGKIVLGGVLGHQFGKRLLAITAVGLMATELVGGFCADPHGMKGFQDLKMVSLVRGFRMIALAHTIRWGLRGNWFQQALVFANCLTLGGDAFFALNKEPTLTKAIGLFFDFPEE